MYLEYKIVYKLHPTDKTHIKYNCIVDICDNKRNINVVREYRNYVNEHIHDYYLMVLQINLLDDKMRFEKVIK